ncbi:multiple monosaccharide ABC transporter permease [Roseateles depolymerans]|uniref:Xylose transport system permease protein XylH n=1 Tax=Roseateles depolymerans TaxID=76731 RepID=A0A0U3MYW8_9BURK|nr:multiple monosaccharide ABC transporter permease [Roseateles depolymerans]ALV07076.1 ABC transporter permease [Roseateles depolymerans]REG20059.1 multiple monosaccharide ABC transporter membrane protein [Roseateles depolymerans]
MHDPLTAPVHGAPASRTAPPPAPRGSAQGGIAHFLKRHLRDYGMLITLVAIMGLFQFLTDGTLLQPLNLTNLVLQNSYIVIMALGMLLVIVAGHIDLSVGSVCGFIGALGAVLMVNLNWPVFPAAVVCLVAGAIIGAAQGWFVAYLGIPSFIVTLAGMLVFKGLALALLQGQSLGPFPDSFQALSAGFLPELFNQEDPRPTTLGLGLLLSVAAVVVAWRHRSAGQMHGMDVEPGPIFLLRQAVIVIGVMAMSWLMASYKGLPTVMVVMVVLTLVYDFIAGRTTLGRRVYAVGGNEKAARLSGVRTERVAFFTFVNMGVLAALAGLVFAARLNTASPKAGLGFELDVIAACFVGGASASGGVGKIMGAVIGAFVMGVMNNGMSILGIGIDYQQVIKGLVLLAAVFIDVYNKRK